MKKVLILLAIILTIAISNNTKGDAWVDSTDEGTTYNIAPDSVTESKVATNIKASDTVEIYVIDNFVLTEKKLHFVLSFFTSEKTKSKIFIDDNKEIIVSDKLSDSHRDTVNLSLLKLKTKTPHFYIVVEDSLGRKYTSERYDIEIPQDVDIKGDANFLLLCLFGGTVFALPTPDYVYWNGKSYFGLTKEIPLIFIRSSSYAYPTGYFSFEYSYIWNAPVRNFLRFGYKHIIELPGIEYISPGISGVTNFNGFNGISPEITIGWFKVFNVFTLYSRFRFSVMPGDKNSEIKDISIGLYSGFFAIYF